MIKLLVGPFCLPMRPSCSLLPPFPGTREIICLVWGVYLTRAACLPTPLSKTNLDSLQNCHYQFFHKPGLLPGRWADNGQRVFFTLDPKWIFKVISQQNDMSLTEKFCPKKTCSPSFIAVTVRLLPLETRV